MLPSTIPLTWPTRDELDHALQSLEVGMNEYDLISLRLHHLLDRHHDENLPEGVPAPTLEDIGALARFVELARLDVGTIEGFVKTAETTYKRAAYHVAERDDA